MELGPDPLELLGQAKAAHEEGRLEDARLLARQVVQADSNNIEALLLLGVIAVKQGRPKLAQMLLGQVIQADRRSFFGHYWLSVAFQQSGQFEEALGMAERAVSLSPDDTSAQSLLLRCYSSLGRHDDVVIASKRLATMDRGVVAESIKRAESLYDLMELDEAERIIRLALKFGDDVPSVHSTLVKILLAKGRPAEAEEHAREAVRLSPGDPSPLTLYGNVLEALGRFEEAAQRYQDSIAAEPRQGFSYFGLARLGKGDPLLESIEELRQEARMPNRDLAYLNYALGKLYEDCGEYGTAMESYDRANHLTREVKFGSTPPEFEPDSELFIGQGHGSDSEAPVFVVGMMRSGTTLVEQILSCHPDIGASGEQLFWPKRFVQALQPQELPSLAAEYLELLHSYAPGKARVVDKMPDNYKLLGLLHAAFPNARIIHVTRNSIDTCLSIWTTPNEAHLDWAHNKANIVAAYEQYLSYMAHWQATLPSERMLEVSYEGLVLDAETVTRRMIDFCGLPWSDACLSPEQNPRSISTPSVWQVRQPIHRGSIERWRRFEPWLGEFKSLPAVEAASLAGKGQARLRQGKIDEANRLFEKSIDLNPHQGFAYLALCYSRRAADPSLVERMESLGNLSTTDRIDLEYALGKAKQDLGDFEAAMKHFDTAHGLCERGAPLDEVAHQLSLEFSIHNFDADFLSSNRAKGSADETPVFVVGMIRSGTTLAEQILSCHPAVGSAGELPFWSDHRTDPLLPPGNIVDPVKMKALTDEYSTLLRQVAPTARRVVDKMPNNYLHLGILRAAYPNARIIHMRRNPIDTCLSIWKTPNQARLDWCHSKHEIVFTYRCYLRLMEHWRSILSPDRFLEIQYEDLVSNQETVTRRMIGFCGLEWHDACLRPEANSRPVLTPSAWQVRQPIYSSSVESWRKFEPWLGEFADLK